MTCFAAHSDFTQYSESSSQRNSSKSGSSSDVVKDILVETKITPSIGMKRERREVTGTNIALRYEDEAVESQKRVKFSEMVVNEIDASTICKDVFDSDDIFLESDFDDLCGLDQPSEEELNKSAAIIRNMVSGNDKIFYETLSSMNLETLSRVFVTL
jgi:hypothetical protein